MSANEPKRDMSEVVQGAKNAIAREWRALVRKPAPLTTGLDLDGSTLRIAQIQMKAGKPELRAIGSAPLRDLATGAIHSEAKELIARLGVARGRVVAFLPRSQAAVKQIVLPTSEPEELRRMARYEAAQLLPRSPDELLADVEILEREADGSCRVWLIATTQQHVENLLNILNELGLEPQRIEISTTALARAFPADEERVAICHISENRADVIVRAGGETKFTRGIDLASLNGNGELLSDEILRSIEYGARGDERDGKASIHLMAPRERRAQLQERLANSIHFIDRSFTTFTSVNGVTEDLSPFAAAIGAALGSAGDSDESSVNFLPASLVNRREIRSRVRAGFATAALSVCALVLASAVTDRLLDSAESSLESMREEMAELRPEVRELRRLQQRSAAIAAHLDPSSDALEVLAEIYRVAPSAAAISHFRMARGQVALKGQGRDFQDVWKLVNALSSSPMFADARVQFATRREVHGTPVVDFNLQLAMAGGGGEP